jgi:hypothetical protein
MSVLEFVLVLLVAVPSSIVFTVWHVRNKQLRLITAAQQAIDQDFQILTKAHNSLAADYMAFKEQQLAKAKPGSVLPLKPRS